MVPSVPGIETNVLRKRNQAQFRVDEPTGEVLTVKRTQESDQSNVQGLEEHQAGFERYIAIVRKLGPSVFVVCFDDGLVLRQRPFEPDEAVQVAVAYVVYHLPHGPAIGPIGHVELLLGKTFHRRAHLSGQRFYLVDPASYVFVGHFSVVLKLANRVAKGVH